jgi:Domain of unknown function (DUF4157)
MNARDRSPQGPSGAGAVAPAAPAVGKHTLVQRLANGAAAATDPDPGSAVQRRGDGAGDDGAVHEAARLGTRGASQALPHLDTIQRLFGRHDVTGVKAHTGSDAEAGARAMGAQAFASGDHVAFAGTPSLHTAAHEAAHVVQQRGGVQLKGGVGQVGDAYEQHADRVADLVVRGESAEPVLDQMAGGGGGGGGGAVQRAPVSTSFGTFNDETYAPLEVNSKKVGVDMVLSFDPGTKVDPGDKVEATKIGLVQSVKSIEGGAPTLMNPGDAGKGVKGGKAEGRQIDRVFGNNNPVYGSERLPAGKGLDATPESNAPTGEKPVVGGDKENASYVLGHRIKDDKNWKSQPAKLHDKPKLPPGGPNSSQVFETTALALEGKDKDKYYGSVSWGWKTDGDGNFTQLPLTKVSDGKPSEQFTDPAKQWNQYQVAAKINQPDKDGNTTTKTDLEVDNGGKSFTIAAGSKLNVDLKGKSIGGTMIATLSDPAQVVDGGTYWWSWIATAKVKDGAVIEDLTLKAYEVEYKLAKGSKVVEVGSSEIGGERLYKLGAAVLRGLAIAPRIVWIRDAELKGDKTVALPVP